MIYINNFEKNPYYNLALEEYLLNELKEDIIMLWQNKDSVIIGKNQNVYEEINLKYTKENNINIVRRETGGGAVFHDLGNINFTFISEYDISKDFKYFSKSIIDMLKSFGVDAYFKGRNDIFVDGMKVSGNAQTIKKNRILHHGTLLFDSDLSKVKNIINKNNNYNSNSVKSNLSKVTNLKNYIKKDMMSEEFFYECKNFLIEYFCINEISLSKEDIKKINILMENKYLKDSFIYGSFKEYSFIKEKTFTFGKVKVCLDIKDGFINDIEIFGDFFSEKNISDLKKVFLNQKHDYKQINKIVENTDVSSFILGISKNEFTELLF